MAKFRKIKQNIDVTIEVCGTAGEGTTVLGELFSIIFANMGYYVFGFNSYPAEIKGFGRCIAKIRVSDKKIFSLSRKSDFFISLNDKHSLSVIDNDLKDNGILIFENASKEIIKEGDHIISAAKPSQLTYGFPINDLSHNSSGSAKNRNIVVLGIFAALFDLDYDIVYNVLEKRFGKKNKGILTNILNSFKQSYEFTKKDIIKIDTIYLKKIEKSANAKIITGNKAIALSAIDSNLYLYSGYPITPATSIMEYLIPLLKSSNGKFIQAEDEISAFGIALGTFYAGKRAMTATSGPGFCLMSEYCNFSVMAEIPMVLAVSQRGGPSTGLPTKTEQSDILFACFGSTGDSPRIVLTPTNIKECYYLTSIAFYLAEKYQTLVIILVDFYLSNRFELFEKVKIKNKHLNGNIFPSKKQINNYKRYEITKDYISPRAIPSMKGYCHSITGLEHNEHGAPVYSGQNHMLMNRKRIKKLDNALTELEPTAEYGYKGKCKVGLIACGSTAGGIIEAALLCSSKGLKVSAMKLRIISPLPKGNIKKFFNRCEKIICVEVNSTGQLAKILKMNFRNEIDSFAVSLCDTIHPEQIIEYLKEKRYI